MLVWHAFTQEISVHGSSSIMMHLDTDCKTEDLFESRSYAPR